MQNTVENNHYPDGFYYPLLEGAEQMILSDVDTRAREIYGNNPPPPVKARIDSELKAICEHNFSVIYAPMAKIANSARQSGYPVSSGGCIASSFVAYLIGITDINPLPAHYICKECKHSEFVNDDIYDIGADLPDMTCPICGCRLHKDGFNLAVETLLGIDGDMVPRIELYFPHEYIPRATEQLEEIFGKTSVFRIGDTFSDYGTFFIIPPNTDASNLHYDELRDHFLEFNLSADPMLSQFLKLQRVTNTEFSSTYLDSKDEYNLILANSKDNAIGLNNFRFQNMLEFAKPSSFSSLISLSALFLGSGTWEDNAEMLIADGIADLSKTISSMDSVFHYLAKNGFSSRDAHKYMQIIRRGALREKPHLASAFKADAEINHIPDWYINSALKIHSLYPKSQATVFALEHYRLARCQLHYPNEFRFD